MGLEPMTSSLPRRRSTPELQQLSLSFSRGASAHQPGEAETAAAGPEKERVKGIEPSYSAWKAAALPLSYTRVEIRVGAIYRRGRQMHSSARLTLVTSLMLRVSKTLVSILQWGLQDSNLCRHSQWIYSPPPLTTRANPHKSLSPVVVCFAIKMPC